MNDNVDPRDLSKRPMNRVGGVEWGSPAPGTSDSVQIPEANYLPTKKTRHSKVKASLDNCECDLPELTVDDGEIGGKRIQLLTCADCGEILASVFAPIEEEADDD